MRDLSVITVLLTLVLATAASGGDKRKEAGR
jgi:hypothetical protein